MSEENRMNAARFTDADLPLYAMAGGFGMWRAWRAAGLDKAWATYDVFVRDLPRSRNFLVFTGLEEALQDILRWRFSEADIATLVARGLIDREMAAELQTFTFDVDIEAMREGTVFFPGEPVLKLRGPLYKLELLYLYLLTVVSSNTIFSSKCVRLVLAAGSKRFFLPGARAQSFESCFKCMRAMYICGGFPSSSQISFWTKFGLDLESVLVAPTHAFISSFSSEQQAMEIFARLFPEAIVPILVDTYDFEKGVESFIAVAHHIREERGKAPLILYIDSGDLAERAIYARRKLDEARLHEIRVLVSGNLDEYKVEALLRRAPIDLFLGLTEIVNSVDAPSLEVVYKLAEVVLPEGARGAMKLSSGKKSYPGRKQVYRIQDEDGIFVRDVLGLEGEDVPGAPLLEKVVEGGRLVQQQPTLSEMRAHVQSQLRGLPARLKRLTPEAPYPVELSSGLQALAAKLQREHA